MRRVQISSYVVWAWLGVGCLIFPSCGPSIESIVEQYRGAVEERLAQVVAVSKLVEDADVDGGIGFAGVVLDFHQTDQFVLNPSWNTGVIHAERLRDLTGYYDKLGLVIGELYFLSNAQSSLDGDSWVMDDEPSSVEAALQRASQIRYLFVIRKIEHKLPRSLEGQGFLGGKYRADAICYDLEDGEQLGGFEFEAGNSDSGNFSYTTSDTNVHGNRGIRKLRAIQSDLKKNAKKAFYEAVEVASPGAKRPKRLNY